MTKGRVSDHVRIHCIMCVFCVSALLCACADIFHKLLFVYLTSNCITFFYMCLYNLCNLLSFDLLAFI